MKDLGSAGSPLPLPGGIGRWLAGLTLAVSAAAPLEAQVIINELLADNKSICVDEDGDFEDWIELYNPGTETIGLGSYGVSEDRSLRSVWRLPDVELAPGAHLLVFMSGKDRYVAAPTAIDTHGSSAVAVDQFRPGSIGTGVEWRYLIADLDGPGPPSGWNLADFDDGGWNSGRPGLGYRDRPGGAGREASAPSGSTPTVFLRRTFDMRHPAGIANLFLRMRETGDFVAFLNGARVAASPPREAASWPDNGPAENDIAAAERFDLSPFLHHLVPGRNVLAIALVGAASNPSAVPRADLGTVPAYVHASFKLDKGGQLIALVRLGRGTVLVDSLEFPPQVVDQSYGRGGDGAAAWGYFPAPTPGTANARAPLAEPLAGTVVLAPPSGCYADPVTVAVSTSLPAGVELRYTTDGREPTIASDLYAAPLLFAASTVVRVGGFRGGTLVTSIASASYFVGVDFDLPLLSIVMDPDDYRAVHLTAAARGRGSEREAYMEVLENGRRVANARFGLRLHGGASRNGDFETKKSYRLYFRPAYGEKKLRHPIIADTFVDRFDKLVLRAGFNDSFRGGPHAAYIRDQVIRDLHSDMGMLISHGDWCNLFVNMKWRGVFNVVERLDEDFLRLYTGDADWDVIKTGDEAEVGDLAAWKRLRRFVAGTDLGNDDRFHDAARLIDLENFTSYMLLNIWAQNHDWPHNNWYAARPRRPDGRWMFLCWDAEFGMGLIPVSHAADTFEFIFSRKSFLRELLENLLANRSYREYFVEEADRHRYGTFSPENVLAHLERLRELTFDDMEKEAALFGRSRSDWLTNVETCASFARYRGRYFFDSIARSVRFEFPPVTTPRILRLSDREVLSTGEERLRVFGVRLSRHTEFYLAGVRVPAAIVRRGREAEITIPLDLRLEGAVTLAAVDQRTGKASAAPELLAIELPRPVPATIVPPTGVSGGGELVRITGTGFLPRVEVRFGAARALGVRLVEGAPQVLEVITPPGSGPAEVVVVNRVTGGSVPARTGLPFRYRSGGFVRGDADGDGRVGVGDALRVLTSLSAGNAALRCVSAADANDSGTVDVSDALYLLAHLFQGAAAPAAPYPRCGDDPTSDELTCGTAGVCVAG